MNEKNLWIMVGIPGSGKTTYVKKYKNNINTLVVSNDEIYFDLKAQYGHIPYFNYDLTTFNEYCRQIQEGIDNNILNIYCDGMHITENMRYRLLHNLKIKDYKINVIVMNIPLDICLQRNEQRIGEARLSSSNIKGINQIFKHPSKDHIHYDKIIDIYE